jgi:segregation and condensation protein A
MEINYKLTDFEGPLDLLLTLIAKNEMSIADVEILTIINQYLAIIRSSQQKDLDSASEFIDMAARLVYIKSVYLLPKDNEGEKLKADLQGELVEYSQAKKAANLLSENYIADKIVTRPPLPLPIDANYNIVHSTSVLTSAYARINDRNLRCRPPEIKEFNTIVKAPVVSVNAKIFFIMRNIIKKTCDDIYSVFENVHTKSEAVATFLAVLELVHARRVSINDMGKMKIIRKGN